MRYLSNLFILVQLSCVGVLMSFPVPSPRTGFHSCPVRENSCGPRLLDISWLLRGSEVLCLRLNLLCRSDFWSLWLTVYRGTNRLTMVFESHFLQTDLDMSLIGLIGHSPVGPADDPIQNLISFRSDLLALSCHYVWTQTVC